MEEARPASFLFFCCCWDGPAAAPASALALAVPLAAEEEVEAEAASTDDDEEDGADSSVVAALSSRRARGFPAEGDDDAVAVSGVVPKVFLRKSRKEVVAELEASMDVRGELLRLASVQATTDERTSRDRYI